LSGGQDIAGALVTGDLDNVVETGAESPGDILTVTGTAPLTAAWQAASGAGADVQVYTADDTWVKPAAASAVDVILIGGGGGGGAGCCGVAGTNRSSGQGGWGGGMTLKKFRASDLPATVDIFVGTGGTGGAAVGPGAANGITGGTSEGTAFGGSGPPGTGGPAAAGDEFAFAYGGSGGPGGATSGDTSFAYPPQIYFTTEHANENSNNLAPFGSNPTNRSTGTPSAFPQDTGLLPGAGHSGGGLNTSNTQRAGGVGRRGDRVGQDNAGGTAGAVGGGDGGDGVSSMTLAGGGGGGGGGSSNVDTVDGGDGGNAGLYGAGGGGGGSATSGGTAVSGAGGDGAPGIAIVVTYP